MCRKRLKHFNWTARTIGTRKNSPLVKSRQLNLCFFLISLSPLKIDAMYMRATQHDHQIKKKKRKEKGPDIKQHIYTKCSDGHKLSDATQTRCWHCTNAKLPSAEVLTIYRKHGALMHRKRGPSTRCTGLQPVTLTTVTAFFRNKSRGSL